ncbi:TPA: AI-2E family transporter [Candidatus Berkelbacteria bacterium]|uniref:Permease n=1 Tax=Berkelbacteria bacterium GW2011_GWE1_39_12 TaxID=1618337 RepID=A0A0G4B3P2_9BACT|nr:MAG: hypothetical protein UT28_C0001G0791 [Berkelbacteria bacterium GW2011_GWE1_39_12]HBO60340.1 AI-2E family transporter [Candidatus Berkelbacteria bacterium]
MENRIKIDVSLGSILKVALVVLGLWFFFVVRDVLLLFFIVLIIVAALGPLVDKMSKFMPRFLSVLILAIIFLGILTAVGFLFIPPLVSQISQLAVNIPVIVNKLGPVYHSLQAIIPSSQSNILNLSSQLEGITSGIYTTTVGFFTGLVALLTIIVMSFYMLLEQNSIKSFVYEIVPYRYREVAVDLLKKISDKMGSWLRGHVLLMLVVGLLDFIALSSVGVPYALTLGLWGGLTEVIPYIGPWLGLLPAVIIAFTISPIKALIIIIVYFLIQQLESSFFAPKILGKAVGLSPVIIILALLIGGKLMGILGVIIAVPVAAALSVLFQEWPELKKIKS